MRKWNALITALIMFLFLLHGIFGAFQLFGIGSSALKVTAWAAVVLMLVHTFIGVRLTIDSIRVWKQTGTGYFRENLLFWARRISGLAIFLLMGLHMSSFGTQTEAGYRLELFGNFRLAVNLLLVLSLLVHIVTNLRPMLIALGFRSFRRWMGDVLLILSVLLLFMAGSMIVYFIRWNSL